MGDVLKITYFYSRNYSYDDCKHEIRTAEVGENGKIEEETRSTISSETISDIYSYCRKVVMVGLDIIFQAEGRLGEPGIQVQIDEMKDGKWEHHCGRFADGY